MKKELAIIIPAYKQTYLNAALDSIAAQTNKDFTLYIGDDCSPYDLYSIVKPYESLLDIVYRRFETNLGGKDLVAQWERCIDMTQGEDWLWLFSDDDMMDSECVNQFYQAKKKQTEAKMIHFDVNKIDKEGCLVTSLPKFGEYISCKEYVDGKLRGQLLSFVVEFIVKREIFFGMGRFENFDLAWGSDFVSWIKFSDKAGGIQTCPSARVNWRSSGINITTRHDRKTIYRKLCSTIAYTTWILDFSQQHKWGHPWFYSKFMFGEIRRNIDCLSVLQAIFLYGKALYSRAKILF